MKRAVETIEEYSGGPMHSPFYNWTARLYWLESRKMFPFSQTKWREIGSLL